MTRLASYGIVDSGPDARFDRVTRMAADLFNVPMALIALAGETQVWLKSAIGFPASTVERDASFCAHAILQDAPLVVPDTHADPRFRDLDCVAGTPQVRFYAGATLLDGEGFRLGVLAVMDTEPREFDDRDRRHLRALAEIAVDALEAHRSQVIARGHGEAVARAKSVLAMNEQLGRIIDQSINEVYILEPQTLRVKHMNRTARENLGYSAAETMLLTALDFKADWDCQALNAMLEPLRRGEQNHVFCRGKHRRKDGSVYPIEGVVETSLFGDEKVLVGIVTDITEKVTAEEQLDLANERLAANEQRFRRIYRETPAMIYSLTRDRRFVDASDAFLARIGYAREEVMGRHLSEFITEGSERKAQSEILPQFWRDGACKDIAYQYRTKDGKMIDVEFSAIVFAQGEGPDDPVIHTVVNDVTERNRAQFELAIRERQYRAVLNDTPGLMSRMLADTTLTFANPPFCDLFGQDSQALLGQPLTRFMAAEDAAVLTGKIADLNSDNPSRSFEQQTVDAVGNPVWLWWSMRGYFNETGEVAEIQFIGRDITPIKLLQVELGAKNALLEQANADLLRVNESLNQFAYIASHDLQEPLRKISTFVSLLKHGVETTNRSEIDLAVPVIIDSVHRARHLVSDILAYSRIINCDMSHERVNLHQMVSECLEVFSETIAETGATIVTKDLDVDLTADRGQLDNLLHNLVSNALKYRSPERAPVVTIASRPGAGDGTMDITIQDNGIGFQSEYAETIFEPFRRLHPRAQYPGSGIGLAICRTVTRRHGWLLGVQSTPGEGSVFTITVPREAALRMAS